MRSLKVALLQLICDFGHPYAERCGNYTGAECLPDGNAYRHPQKYKLLTEECRKEPFVRADYRR